MPILLTLDYELFLGERIDFSRLTLVVNERIRTFV